jgi:DNA-binding NarL/FixJ family response regulator
MMEGTHCPARGQCILDRMSPWSDNPRRLIDAYAVGQGVKRILSNAPDIVIVVREAESVQEAPEALATETYDVVSLAPSLSDGSGFDVLMHLTAT